VTGPRPEDHIWWLASRASGIIALALMSASVILGLAMATRLLRQPGLPRKLSALHEQLAVTSLVAIGLHGVTLLGDPWLRPGVEGILVPGSISYRPLHVGLGIAGGYLAAALGLSYYARRRIGSARWRKAHRYVIVAWALSFAHTLGAGTDASQPWLRTSMIAIATLVAALLALRIGLSLAGRSSAKAAAAPGAKPNGSKPEASPPRPREREATLAEA
jgi:methionine sulfoxide reductase heme-binding subunit